jgi:hypothetical protein
VTSPYGLIHIELPYGSYDRRRRISPFPSGCSCTMRAPSIGVYIAGNGIPCLHSVVPTGRTFLRRLVNLNRLVVTDCSARRAPGILFADRVDYGQRQAQLEASGNPFALAVLAHLKTLEMPVRALPGNCDWLGSCSPGGGSERRSRSFFSFSTGS